MIDAGAEVGPGAPEPPPEAPAGGVEEAPRPADESAPKPSPFAFSAELGLTVVLVATVVLARLLSPTDFGVVAAAMSVFLFFSLASAWGFGAAVVRRRELDEPFLRGILAANLAMAVVLIGLAWLPFQLDVGCLRHGVIRSAS